MDLIDRNFVLSEIEEEIEAGHGYPEDELINKGLRIARKRVALAPAVEAELVRHGRWIVHTTWHGMFGLIHSECSECKFDQNGDLSSWKFCPNCGADMREGGADNG